MAQLNGGGLFLLAGGAALCFYGWIGRLSERQWAKRPPKPPTTPREERSRKKVARAIRLARQRFCLGATAVAVGAVLILIAAISH